MNITYFRGTSDLCRYHLFMYTLCRVPETSTVDPGDQVVVSTAPTIKWDTNVVVENEHVIWNAFVATWWMGSEFYFLVGGLQPLGRVLQFFYARLKKGHIMPWQCPSNHLSVCPSVCIFPDFFSSCFEISIQTCWYIYLVGGMTCLSLSFITIGSLWPSSQTKVGQTYLLQSWPHGLRLILQIQYIGAHCILLDISSVFGKNHIFIIFGDCFGTSWIFRRFPGFFSTCFEISICNLVHTSSRWF